MDGRMDRRTDGRTDGRTEAGMQAGDSTFKAPSMVVLPGDVELPEEVVEGRPDTGEVGQDVIGRV